MSLVISKNLTQRQYDWTTWKSIQASKNLVTQYEDDGNVYTIFGYDGPEIILCTIYKGNVPTNVQDNGYSQAQNNADKADFESNFKPSANKPIVLRSADGRTVGMQTENSAAEGFLSGSLADVVNAYMSTAATSTVPIRATAYTEMTGSGVVRSLKSSVATDVSGSTGAWSVQIKYYDDNMNGPFYETVNMNGTGSVNTVNTNIRFVDWMKTVLAGSNGGNDGTITLFNSPGGAGSAVGTIAAGDGQTFWSHHYVRPNRTCYVREYMFSATAVSMKIFVRLAKPLTPNSYTEIKGTWIRVNAGDSSQQGEYEVPLQFPGPCRVELVVKPDVITAGTVFAAYGYYEV